VLNIIIPGLSLIDDNNTTRPPTCHVQPYRPPGIGDPEFWTGTLWGALIFTLVITITVGTVVAIYLHRRRERVRSMFEQGLISKEEYMGLK
jgi:hypothetical protein